MEEMTNKEKEYAADLLRFTAGAAKGTRLGQKAEALPQDTEEWTRAVKECLEYCELLARGRTDILAAKYGTVPQPDAGQLAAILSPEGVDMREFRKKLKSGKKYSIRKLYIADQHFFHGSMNARMDRRGFPSTEAMNEYMVEKWNANVREKDEVYILGDFCMSARVSDAESILCRLTGKKYLIEGNHDKFLHNRKFDRSLLEWSGPYLEVNDSGHKVVLCHYPITCYKWQYRTLPDGSPLAYMFYGHVHDTHDERLVDLFIRETRKAPLPEGGGFVPCNMVNCFCMFSDYAPLTLNEWVRTDQARREALAGNRGRRG